MKRVFLISLVFTMALYGCGSKKNKTTVNTGDTSVVVRDMTKQHQTTQQSSSQVSNETVNTQKATVTKTGKKEIPAVVEAEKERKKADTKQNEINSDDNIQSVKLNSPLALGVDNHYLSIGDTINVNTYFSGDVPEGITYNRQYIRDNEVSIRSTSYLRSSGSITIYDVKNKVIQLNASAPFTFMDFNNDMTLKEVKSILGIGLTSKEQEVFQPLRDDISIIDTGHTGIEIHIGDKLDVKMQFKSNLLDSIQITDLIEADYLD